MSQKQFPKLRSLDFQPVFYEGQQMWLVQDPLQLSEQQLILPPILAQLTVYCDGEHDIDGIRAALRQQTGVDVPRTTIEETLDTLNAAYLLDNARSRALADQIRAAYRTQPYRPMAFADLGYPRAPAALEAQFARYGAGDNGYQAARWAAWNGRAIVSPHIDYARGGNVYAQVWKRAKTAVQNADLILMFATDHRGGYASITLTPQAYATPYGIIPTDTDLVDTLAQAIGEDKAYALELNHRQEHAVELSAVWMDYAAGGESPPMVPILIGSFQHFVANGSHPAEDHTLNAFVETLIAETQDKNVLCVASVDLAHVGPAFQDSYKMDEARREALVQTDESLMEAILEGDVERFYDEIAAVQDANKVCGFSPIYLMLRYLNGVNGGGLTGHKIAYQHCPADPQDHSLVSICGLLLE